jgi:predicted nucleic acid-binding protein
VLDAGAPSAQSDRTDPHHGEVVEILPAEREPLVDSAVEVEEADYLSLSRLGIEVELSFREDLAEGTFQVEYLTRAEMATALLVARRHRDLAIGLADASLVVLAQRFRTRRLVTFDERAFRSISPLQGGRSHSCQQTGDASPVQWSARYR